MAGEVKLPVVGQVKTTYLVGGVVIVGVIVGYAYLRRRSSSSGSSGTTAAADNTATDSIDPQTGYATGSPQDEAALQSIASGSYGSGADYGEGDYYGTGTGINGAEANTGPGTFTDNAYWLAYAEQNITGYSATQIQGALAAYLAGMTLTSAQYTVYQIALGVAGPPPNPPATPAPPTTTPPVTTPPPVTTTPPPTTGTVTVPLTVGSRAETAEALLKADGLLVAPGPAQKKGTAYWVTASSPPHGTKVAVGSTVTLTTSTKKP